MLHSNYLKQLDLQDIVLFLTLLEQRNAKRTAEIMNVSQPTVSYGLKRLRNCFDDFFIFFGWWCFSSEQQSREHCSLCENGC